MKEIQVILTLNTIVINRTDTSLEVVPCDKNFNFSDEEEIRLKQVD